MDIVSLDPDREPITRPVFVWLEVAARLHAAGNGALGDAIAQGMDGRRLGDNARVPLTTDERARVDAALQEWLGGQDLN